MQRLSKTLPWFALGLVTLVLIISYAYGFQYLFPGSNRLQYFGLLSVPFAAILAAMSWHGLRATRPMSSDASSSLGFLLMTVSFASTSYLLSAGIQPLPWLGPAVTVPGIAWACQQRWGSRGGTVAFLIGAFVLYALLIYRVPHHQGANMLMIIEAASRELFEGRLPYRVFPQIAGEAPFAYLPALWLPYAAVIKLGLDPRILNLALLAFLVVLFERGDPAAGRSQVLSIVFYPLVLSSTTATMMVHGHIWPYWIYLTATALALLSGKYLAGAVAFGLCLASRQPSLLLVLLLIAYLYRTVGVQKMLGYAALSFTVYAVLVLPFAVWTGVAFWDYHYLGLAKYIAMGDQDPMLGVVSILGMFGWTGGTTLLQATVAVLASLAVILRRKLDVIWFLVVAGLTYTWLVFFAFYSIRYEYLPGFLLIALALSAAPTRGNFQPAGKVD